MTKSNFLFSFSGSPNGDWIVISANFLSIGIEFGSVCLEIIFNVDFAVGF